MGNRRDSHRRAFHPVEHPERQLQPAAGTITAAAASHDIAGRLLDYFMNLYDAPDPQMPWINDLALFNPVGVPSSRCIIPRDHTRAAA